MPDKKWQQKAQKKCGCIVFVARSLALPAIGLSVIVLLIATTVSITKVDKLQTTFASKVDDDKGSNDINSSDDARWFVGRGAMENMNLKYDVYHIGTNNGQPFNMTVNFSEFNTTGRYWVAFISVEDGDNNNGGRANNGTFHLRESDLGIIPNSHASSSNNNMSVYKDAYSETLDWVSIFTHKSEPRPLDARSWMKPGCMSCAEIQNLGRERIAVPAGSFDTTVMGWVTDTENIKVWINKDLPYPVKEVHEERADNSSSWSTRSKFELLGIGGIEQHFPSEGSLVTQEQDQSSLYGWIGGPAPLIVGIGAAIAGIVAFFALRKRN